MIPLVLYNEFEPDDTYFGGGVSDYDRVDWHLWIFISSFCQDLRNIFLAIVCLLAVPLISGLPMVTQGCYASAVVVGLIVLLIPWWAVPLACLRIRCFKAHVRSIGITRKHKRKIRRIYKALAQFWRAVMIIGFITFHHVFRDRFRGGVGVSHGYGDHVFDCDFEGDLMVLRV